MTITEKEPLFLEKGSSHTLPWRSLEGFVCLSETEEAEAFAWDLENLEVRSHVTVVQVAVVVSAIISVHEARRLKLR